MGTNDNNVVIKKYVDDIIDGMRSGYFLYVAHPDHIINFHREKNEFVEAQMRRICEESIRLNMPLEINLAGARVEVKKRIKLNDPTATNLFYPYDWFWELVGKKGCKVVVGIDDNPDNFIEKRLVKIIIPFYVVNTFFTVVLYAKGMIEKYELTNCFIGIYMANDHMWYLVEIVLLYTLFYKNFKNL